MSRQAFRSLSSRARPELELGSGPMSNYFRTFSTTSPLLADANNNSSNKNNDGPPKSSFRERTRAVGDRVSAMLKSRPVAAAAAAAPAAVGRTPGAPGKVLDIKVLPRGGLRGRGGFRGRGGPGAGPSAPGAGAGNRFTPIGSRRGTMARGGGRGRGGPGGRGGRGGRGRRGGRGGRAGRDGELAAEGEGADKSKKRFDVGRSMDASLQRFDDVMRFGEETVWTPEFTPESLAAYMPPVPSASAAAARAAVLRNLSTLADGLSAAHTGQWETVHGSLTAKDLREKGMRFFMVPEQKPEAEASLQEWRTEMRALDAQKKEAGEEPLFSKPEEKNLRELMDGEGEMVTGPEEGIRKVVLDDVVRGVHEKPKFAEDTMGMVRSWELRQGSYSEATRGEFEGRVLGLLAKAQRGGAKTRAKA